VVTRVDRLDRLDDANVSLARRSEVRLPASLVGGPDGQRFVTALSQAADLKLAAVCIDDYARLSEPGLARIKQAIRFARREVCE
ncbi:MAG: hypothetical protein ACE5EX_07330, partial [Phycisphaerae bacterium]